MSRDLRLFLEDILIACNKITTFTEGMTFEAFLADAQVRDAVLYNLAVIGEAVKNLPAELRDLHPEVEWRKMAGMRDIVTHEYFGIDNNVLWDVIQNKVPLAADHIRRILDLDDDQVPAGA